MKRRIGCMLLAVCLLCACGTEVQAAASDTGFSDVEATAWYADAAVYCRDNGLMNGTSDATFSPDQATSRAMLVTILYRQAGSPTVSEAPPFSDTPADAWYAAALSWAAENGVIGGYADGRFGPSDPVTRQQMAAILWRYAGSPAAGSGESFADQSAISPYAVSAVAWAEAEGIIRGSAGNRFDPHGSATRAQTAAILHRWQSGGAPEATDTAGDAGNTLVVYFSRTGNTADVAETVAELTGGRLFELVPETPYPDDYNACLEQARQELRDDTRPALVNDVGDLDQYDRIYLGFPIWHGNTPMAIRTFLEAHDFSRKTIAPFATSGSSGISAAVAAIRALCPEAEVTEGLSITSVTLDQTDELAANWVNGLPAEEREGAGTPGLAIQIQIGEQTFTAALLDNPAARALADRLPITVHMSEMNGNELYSFLPERLPEDSRRPGSIQAGDLMLYGSDCLVLFYEGFSSDYSYTPLGSIDDPAGLAAAIKRNGVEVTFRRN